MRCGRAHPVAWAALIAGALAVGGGPVGAPGESTGAEPTSATVAPLEPGAAPVETAPAGVAPAVGVIAAPYGALPDGAAVAQYTLRNRDGMRLALIDYGARIIALEVPDRAGKLTNVVLYRDSLADYLHNDPYFGATIGRFANRLAGGRFSLDGRQYALPTNDGPNHMHGGPTGFDKRIWRADIPDPHAPRVAFTLTSPDGDQGYPGELKVTVAYALASTNEMTIEYTATTDRPTIVNLTNHAYWNLAGEGDILGHELMIAADRYLPVDATLIPTGELRPLDGTPMDFRKSTPIGARIEESPGGYHYCYLLNKAHPNELLLALRLTEPQSGRTLEIDTTEPTMQFYSGGFLDGSIGAGGRVYGPSAAMCLEPHRGPDAPNHPNFANAVLRPGETYRQTTVYKFGVQR